MSEKGEYNRKFSKRWTDKRLSRLHEACILYPKETPFRMKRIANYVGDGFTHNQCSMALWNNIKNPILNSVFKFEATFPSHEKYPFGPDGNPIGNILKWNSNSKWTKELDAKMSVAIKMFPEGSKNCNKNIAKFLGGGITVSQVQDRKKIRLHVHVPEPLCRWTPEMDNKLVDAVKQHTGKRGIHWRSVNQIMNMHNSQANSRWQVLVKQQPEIKTVAKLTAIVTGKNLKESSGKKSSTVIEAEDYLSESDYWMDVSDAATAKRLNKRKRNRDLFYKVWNSSGSVGGSVGSDRLDGKMIDIDINDCVSSVCSDDLISVSDDDCSSSCDNSYHVKRRCNEARVAGAGNSGDVVDCGSDNNSVDFENYVTISDELIDMLGLYDSSSGESDCE